MVSAKDRVIAKITATADKTASARERKQKKGNGTGYVSIWNDAVMDEYGKDFCIAPTMKTVSMLKRALNRLPNQNPTHIKLFIDWAVTTWGQHEFLRSKGKAPMEPTLSIFVFAVDRLYSTYCRKDAPKIRLTNAQKKDAAAGEKPAAETVSKADYDKLAADYAKAQEELRKLKQQLRMLKDK